MSFFILLIILVTIISVFIYFKMTKMSPIDIAKAKIEILLTSDIEEKQIFAIYGYTPHQITGETSTLNTLIEKKLLEIQTEFGVTVVPPEQLDDIKNIDIDNINFQWIPCDKPNEISSCWGEYVGRDKFDLGL